MRARDLRETLLLGDEQINKDANDQPEGHDRLPHIHLGRQIAITTKTQKHTEKPHHMTPKAAFLCAFVSLW